MVNGEVTTIDELKRFGLKIAQPETGYRFSLDPLLLADFVSILPEQGRTIDLGAGSGIIPLILCRKFPGTTAVGIESNGSMAELATRNVLQNNLADLIEIREHDVKHLKREFPVSSFDCVVSNPPFRTPYSGKISPRAGRDTARHESTAGIADFLAAAKYLVKPSGRIWFIYHPDRLQEFVHVASELNLSLLRIRMVHGNKTAPAKIFMAELAKGRKGATEVLAPLIIFGDDGEYTDEARGILGDATARTIT